MEPRASVAIGVGLFTLAIVGLLIGTDLRLIVADLLGAIAASAVAMTVLRGPRAAVGLPAAAAATLLVIALLAVTAHVTPWLTVMSLTAALVFAIVSWTAASSVRRIDVRRRPRAI